MYRPERVDSIDEYAMSIKNLGVESVHKYVYDRGLKRKTAFIHYSHCVEIWECCPGVWSGWKQMLVIDEKQ